MEPRYFEDFRVGDEFTSSRFTFTESDVIQFRRVYGGPLGSDTAEDLEPARLRVDMVQLLAISFRLFYETGAINPSGQGSPGMQEVRYLKPVYSGDTIRVVARVRQVRESASRPDRGTAEIEFSTLNQNEEPVLSFVALQLLGRRNAKLG
jgi:acyl dehydratase